MNDPLVSIIMPTLNAEKYLHDALYCIEKESYQHYEVIIVDGGSKDRTKEIADGFSKIRFTHQRDKGLAGAWNDGIRTASGELITFLDSDDLWMSDCLETHVKMLLNDRILWGSVGHVEFFLENEKEPPPGFKISLLDNNHIGYMPGCFMGWRKIFDEIGFFETRWNIASDIVWFAKLKKSNLPLGIIHETVLKKRVHSMNLSYTTAQTPTYQKELLKLLHESIKK
jgi:glycosyltransferase involved in cell wall biosynthesis